MTPKETELGAIVWQEDYLQLLDQRVLPGREEWITCTHPEEVAGAIKDMVVRGAPAIGITAAYGAVLAVRNCADLNEQKGRLRFEQWMALLAESRPTAVNLVWAIEQAKKLVAESGWSEAHGRVLALAEKIHSEDLAANHRMAALALPFMDISGLQEPYSVLTHCNTGSLATGGHGTALGVIRAAWHHKLIDHVYADETRPWLQGARLTAWELQKSGIPFSLNADSAAAWLMSKRNVRWVIVGADRITANGDVANKIGTYSLAILARHHGIKFMVVAPSSTVDLSLSSGQEIDIEMRTARELTEISGAQIAPENCNAINPVFDVTPAALVDVLVTEKGAIENPTRAALEALISDS